MGGQEEPGAVWAGVCGLLCGNRYVCEKVEAEAEERLRGGGEKEGKKGRGEGASSSDHWSISIIKGLSIIEEVMPLVIN